MRSVNDYPALFRQTYGGCSECATAAGPVVPGRIMFKDAAQYGLQIERGFGGVRSAEKAHRERS